MAEEYQIGDILNVNNTLNYIYLGQVKREAPVFHGCKEGYLYSLIIIMDGKIFGESDITAENVEGFLREECMGTSDIRVAHVFPEHVSVFGETKVVGHVNLREELLNDMLKFLSLSRADKLDESRDIIKERWKTLLGLMED